MFFQTSTRRDRVVRRATASVVTVSGSSLFLSEEIQVDDVNERVSFHPGRVTDCRERRSPALGGTDASFVNPFAQSETDRRGGGSKEVKKKKKKHGSHTMLEVPVDPVDEMFSLYSGKSPNDRRSRRNSANSKSGVVSPNMKTPSHPGSRERNVTVEEEGSHQNLVFGSPDFSGDDKLDNVFHSPNLTKLSLVPHVLLQIGASEKKLVGSVTALLSVRNHSSFV